MCIPEVNTVPHWRSDPKTCEDVPKGGWAWRWARVCRVILSLSAPVSPDGSAVHASNVAPSVSASRHHETDPLNLDPQWGAADAEIKVPSGENTELKRSPFTAWNRSVYSHACCAYCQGFFPRLFQPSGPFTCIFS